MGLVGFLLLLNGFLVVGDLVFQGGHALLQITYLLLLFLRVPLDARRIVEVDAALRSGGDVSEVALGEAEVREVGELSRQSVVLQLNLLHPLAKLAHLSAQLLVLGDEPAHI